MDKVLRQCPKAKKIWMMETQADFADEEDSEVEEGAGGEAEVDASVVEVEEEVHVVIKTTLSKMTVNLGPKMMEMLRMKVQ